VVSPFKMKNENCILNIYCIASRCHFNKIEALGMV
jgi:hypothetical protein